MPAHDDQTLEFQFDRRFTELETRFAFQEQALHLEHMTLLWVRMVRAKGALPHFVWALENLVAGNVVNQITVDPERNEIMMDGRLVQDKKLERGHTHRIYFLPLLERDRIDSGRASAPRHRTAPRTCPARSRRG